MDEQIVFNPSGRRLCPDGSCVGVLDAAGRCGECGLSFGADASANARGPEAAAARSAGTATTASASPEPASTGDSDTGFNANRRLCDDGACVGVVKADGTCDVCGRVARS